MNLEVSEVKPRKIIKMTLLSSAKMICKESRMLPVLRLETKYSKRRHFLKSRRRQLLPKQRQERRKCKLWTRLEPKR